MLAWLDRHQVALYLTALAVGALVGLLIVRTPLLGLGAALEFAVAPALGLLLLATFFGGASENAAGRICFSTGVYEAIVGAEFSGKPYSGGSFAVGNF